MEKIYEINNVAEPIDFECGNDAVKRTLQNCKNLLMCHMGEVPYDRMRGFNRSLMALPLTKFNEQLIKEIDSLLLYEPDAEAVDAWAVIDGNGETIITVRVQVKV